MTITGPSAPVSPFDDSPVPANNRSISIPDQDRLWLSAGTTYAFNKDAVG